MAVMDRQEELGEEQRVGKEGCAIRNGAGTPISAKHHNLDTNSALGATPQEPRGSICIPIKRTQPRDLKNDFRFAKNAHDFCYKMLQNNLTTQFLQPSEQGELHKILAICFILCLTHILNDSLSRFVSTN